MSYFKIDGEDFSSYVSGLTVETSAVYNAQTNAAGDTVVDYMNSKRKLEVKIIPLNDTNMLRLLDVIRKFSVNVSFRNPHTNELDEMHCIIPDNDGEYYTIQTNKVLYKELKLKFTEL